MNFMDLVKFLGLPAQNKDFDLYLTKYGSSYRPVFKETPVDRINFEEKGISLIFDMAESYREMYGPLSEEGSMIFSTVQAYGENNDSGFVEYGNQLPYGLSFKSTLEDATKIFGKPTVDHPSGEGRSYVWYDYVGNTIGISFLPANKGISFFDLSKKANQPPVPFDWD